MTIAIFASIRFTPQIKEIKEKLVAKGHQIKLPQTAKKIINGELTMEQFIAEGAEAEKRKIEYNVMKVHYNEIKDSDVVLVLNFTKNNIENYIGGNTFLEMGFAHILDKPIFLLNDIPKMIYTDELKAFQPIVIHSDLDLIA